MVALHDWPPTAVTTPVVPRNTVTVYGLDIKLRWHMPHYSFSVKDASFTLR